MCDGPLYRNSFPITTDLGSPDRWQSLRQFIAQAASISSSTTSQSRASHDGRPPILFPAERREGPRGRDVPGDVRLQFLLGRPDVSSQGGCPAARSAPDATDASFSVKGRLSDECRPRSVGEDLAGRHPGADRSTRAVRHPGGRRQGDHPLRRGGPQHRLLRGPLGRGRDLPCRRRRHEARRDAGAGAVPRRPFDPLGPRRGRPGPGRRGLGGLEDPAGPVPPDRRRGLGALRPVPPHVPATAARP